MGLYYLWISNTIQKPMLTNVIGRSRLLIGHLLLLIYSDFNSLLKMQLENCEKCLTFL